MKTLQEDIDFVIARWKLEVIVAYLKAANMVIPAMVDRVLDKAEHSDTVDIKYIDAAFDSCVLVNANGRTDIPATEILKKAIKKLTWLHKEVWKLIYENEELATDNKVLELSDSVGFIPHSEIDLILAEVKLRKALHGFFPNEKEVFDKALNTKGYNLIRGNVSGHGFNLINITRNFDEDSKKLYKELFYSQLRLLDFITDHNSGITLPKGKELRPYIKLIGWAPKTFEEAQKTETAVRKLLNELQ